MANVGTLSESAVAIEEPPKPVFPANYRANIRKITLADAEAIAKLVAKRTTEAGACIVLGIKPTSWFQWKHRHKNQAIFETLVTRIRETKLQACIDTIDEAGDSYEIPTKNGSYTKPGDWRAKAWLAERVLAPERFQDGQVPAQAQSSPVVTIQLQRIYSEPSQLEQKARSSDIVEAQVIAGPEPAKAIAGPVPDWHQFTG